MTNLEYSNTIYWFAYNSLSQNSGVGSLAAPFEGLRRIYRDTLIERKHILVIQVVGRIHIRRLRNWSSPVAREERWFTPMECPFAVWIHWVLIPATVKTSTSSPHRLNLPNFSCPLPLLLGVHMIILALAGNLRLCSDIKVSFAYRSKALLSRWAMTPDGNCRWRQSCCSPPSGPHGSQSSS